MPVPGIPNNPEGANGWQGFTAEPPYGEITNQKRLAAGAPLAGQPIASGPINAPERAQGNAAAPTAAAQPTATLPQAAAPAPPTTAEAWATIAALPNISPLALDYARRAAQTGAA